MQCAVEAELSGGVERSFGWGGVAWSYKFILREKPKQAILAILVQIFFISWSSKQLRVMGVWSLARKAGWGLSCRRERIEHKCAQRRLGEFEPARSLNFRGLQAFS